MITRTAVSPRVSWAPYDAEEVRTLYDDYASALDASDYEAWLELFTEDATYTVTGRENVERGLPLCLIRCDSRDMLSDRIDALCSTQYFARRFTRHMVTAVRPTAHADDALETTANFVVVETIVDEVSQVSAAGAYADRIVTTPDGLRFRQKSAVFDSSLIQTSLIVPL